MFPCRSSIWHNGVVNIEDIEAYENGLELELYREYRDVISLFSYVVETDRRFYLANKVNVKTQNNAGGDVFFEIEMEDAWVWDVYRSSRFVQKVKVLTFKDVNVEELAKPEIEIP